MRTLVKDQKEEFASSANRNPGELVLEEMKLPDDCNAITVFAQRDNWPDRGFDTIVIRIEQSIDGTNWESVGKITDAGGVVLGRDGNPRTHTYYRVIFKQPIPGRMIRVTTTQKARFSTRIECLADRRMR